MNKTVDQIQTIESSIAQLTMELVIAKRKHDNLMEQITKLVDERTKLIEDNIPF